MQDAKKIKENLENLIQNMSKDPSSWAKIQMILQETENWDLVN